MSKQVEKHEPTQRGHINLSEPSEILYWAEQLGVTKDEVIEAVKQVGGAVDEVIKDLQRKKSA